MSDPLAAVDALVLAALRESPAVAAVTGGTAHVLAYDSPVAMWDERQSPAGLGAWCWVAPAESEVDLWATSSSARLLRRYRVGIGGDGRTPGLLRAMEYAAMRAMYMLGTRRQAGGAALVDPSPARLVDVSVGASDPDRDRDEIPTGWTDVCVVSIAIELAHADLEVLT